LGGAIIVWTDFRAKDNTDVYAQRLDGDGTRLWGADGLALVTVIEDQFGAHVASDGAGGGIFCWADSRNGDGEADIYAQRVDASGQVLWPPAGKPVTDVGGSQVRNVIISDGLGGAILAWEDGRKNSGENDIYAQRLTAQGVPLWDEGGTAVVSSDEVQIHPALVSDGTGGAYITWQDFYRVGTSWNIYAQHMDGAGIPKWKKDGIAVCVADGIQSDPVIVPDGSGGTVIVWYDGRAGTYFNIYAQQVNALGFLGGGEFRFYTADLDGIPKTSFTEGELIFFKVTWTVEAPTAGTYDAIAAMVINSSTIFRQQSITYEVK
jgi:hypothetical protein